MPQVDAVQVVVGNDDVVAIPNRVRGKRDDIGFGYGIDFETHEENGGV
jgi:hypothetical protein